MFDWISERMKSAESRKEEQVTAFVDGELSARARTQFEAQMASDPTLKADVEKLQAFRAGLRRLPRQSAPRNFILNPADFAKPARVPERFAYPILRGATVLTALMFMLIIGLTTLAPKKALSPSNEAVVALAPTFEAGIEAEKSFEAAGEAVSEEAAEAEPGFVAEEPAAPVVEEGAETVSDLELEAESASEANASADITGLPAPSNDSADAAASSGPVDDAIVQGGAADSGIVDDADASTIANSPPPPNIVSAPTAQPTPTAQLTAAASEESATQAFRAPDLAIATATSDPTAQEVAAADLEKLVDEAPDTQAEAQTIVRQIDDSTLLMLALGLLFLILAALTLWVRRRLWRK